jgi:Family of unknown function (DUF6624)
LRAGCSALRHAEPVEDHQLAAELLARMERDQQVRTEPPDIDAWLAVDADNTAWLEAVVDRQGWPLRSKIGDQAANAAWLLAQHADARPDFQRRCLQLLTDAVDHGEADPSHLAYLTDRVLCAEGRPQRYGTQFWKGPHGTDPLQAQPIDDPDQLDQRRAGVGLGPFADYERHMLDTYGQDS